MDSIIKISEAAAIAIHAVAFLADSGGKPRPFANRVKQPRAKGRGKPGSAKEIAESLGVSHNHLNKVMQRLSRADIVLAHRGPKGGFTLSTKAEKARLKDIFEAIDGKPGFSNCLMKARICKRSKCLLGNLLSDANRKFKTAMDTKIEDLI